MNPPNEKNERLIEAAIAVLQGAASQLNIVGLNKALFYLDLYSLRDTGETLTGATYCALPMGPVVDDYKLLVGSLKRAGYAEQIEEGMAKPVRLLRPDFEFHHLDEAERKLAHTLGRFAADATSTMLSSVSHDNPGWRIAFREQGQKRRINMVVAMQQVADADPWMDEPADEALERAFADSRIGESDEPWA